MLKIYSTNESLYCAKLRILLHHKQAQWQEITPEGGCGSEAYRALIPSGTMPAMIDGDLVIADSEAIAEYLNSRVTPTSEVRNMVRGTVITKAITGESPAIGPIRKLATKKEI